VQVSCSTDPALPGLPTSEPAAVLSPALDVITANRRWRTLHAPLTDPTDTARSVFVDPVASRFFHDLAREELRVVAALDAAALRPEHRDHVAALVRELRATSSRFAARRRGPAVRPLRRDTYVVDHPELGVLTFDRATEAYGPVLVCVAVPTGRAAQVVSLLDLSTDPGRGRASR
jgi:hypothetical protein